MDLASVCGGNNGTSREGTEGGACDPKGLGISLSTPILMMSTGVLGNLLALLILFTAEKQVRRTAFFPLLMAMACNDLVGQAATGSIAVVVYANNLQWVGGRPLCLYHGFIMVFFAVMTPLLVCSMSVERLLALRYSYFYQRHFTPGTARWVVVGSVAFTLFFCSWPLMGFGSYEHQFPGSWCFLNYHRQSPKDMAYALVFSIANLVIIGIIVACNVTVVYTLLKMRRVRRKMNAVPGKAAGGAGGGGGGGGRKMLPIRQRSRSALNLEMETQMVWFLLAITVVFACLWLPINVHILMNQITGKVDLKQDLISVRLASINQIIDPWMYVIFRKTTFLKLLRRLRRFLTQHKKNTSNPLRLSHSCEDHRLKLLMPPRRDSCPPAVCCAVHGPGHAAPTVGVKGGLLVHPHAKVQAVSPGVPGGVLQLTLSGGRDVVEKSSVDAVNEGFVHSQETPPDVVKHDADPPNCEDMKTQGTPDVGEGEGGATVRQSDVLGTQDTLNRKEDEEEKSTVKTEFNNTLDSTEERLKVRQEGGTETTRTSDSTENGLGAVKVDCTGCLGSTDTCTHLTVTLDMSEGKARPAQETAMTVKKHTNTCCGNKRSNFGNSSAGWNPENRYQNAQSRTDGFFPVNSLMERGDKEAVTDENDHDTQPKETHVSVTEDTVANIPLPGVDPVAGSVAQTPLFSSRICTENFSTSPFIIDHSIACEARNTRHHTSSDVSRSNLQHLYDGDNGYESENSPVHIQACLLRNTCVAETTVCEPALLCREGCGDRFLHSPVGLCRCSHDLHRTNAHNNIVVEDC
ncbi:uncharacterized protein LOC143280427 [Babylonia areolata]|uniref:uncharacterized protein LOC143280427 n=1 Tax=Babylonia areolata TaxID=304850 RepID=UPI003FD06380